MVAPSPTIPTVSLMLSDTQRLLTLIRCRLDQGWLVRLCQQGLLNAQVFRWWTIIENVVDDQV